MCKSILQPSYTDIPLHACRSSEGAAYHKLFVLPQGNQVGTAFWQTISGEHGLDNNGV
jgi:hypothetical protein